MAPRGGLQQLLRRAYALQAYPLQALQRSIHTSSASQSELAVTEESPFVRYSTPVPQPNTFVPALATLPATRVRIRVQRGAGCAQRPRQLMCCLSRRVVSVILRAVSIVAA